MIAPTANKTLSDLLKKTSRAFYLSLAVLPQKTRSPLSLAYLIARAADTIADNEGFKQKERIELLKHLKICLTQAGTPWVLPSSEPCLANVDTELLQAVPSLLQALHHSPPNLRSPSIHVLDTLITGMLWDLEVFNPETSLNLSPNGLSDDDLERYTYLVAGCVGPFWSHICALANPELSTLLSYEELAIDFGKGLQWVNILRDVPSDQKIARFYLPPLSFHDFRPRFTCCARRALTVLRHAQSYPLLFPPICLRERLAVFWPLTLGLRTLEKLFKAGGPQAGTRIKVSRLEVLFWVLTGPLWTASNPGLSFIFRILWNRAHQALIRLETHHVTSSR